MYAVIDSETKDRATKALQAMGLSVSDAIRLLLLRVAEEQRLPFSIQAPNATTAKAMKELDEGRGRRFGTVEELFRDLELRIADPGSVNAVQARRQKGRQERPGLEQTPRDAGVADPTGAVDRT